MNYNTSRDGNGIDRSYVQPNSTIPQIQISNDSFYMRPTQQQPSYILPTNNQSSNDAFYMLPTQQQPSYIPPTNNQSTTTVSEAYLIPTSNNSYTVPSSYEKPSSKNAYIQPSSLDRQIYYGDTTDEPYVMPDNEDGKARLLDESKFYKNLALIADMNKHKSRADIEKYFLFGMPYEDFVDYKNKAVEHRRSNYSDDITIKLIRHENDNNPTNELKCNRAIFKTFEVSEHMDLPTIVSSSKPKSCYRRHCCAISIALTIGVIVVLLAVAAIIYFVVINRSSTESPTIPPPASLHLINTTTLLGSNENILHDEIYNARVSIDEQTRSMLLTTQDASKENIRLTVYYFNQQQWTYMYSVMNVDINNICINNNRICTIVGNKMSRPICNGVCVEQLNDMSYCCQCASSKTICSFNMNGTAIQVNQQSSSTITDQWMTDNDLIWTTTTIISSIISQINHSIDSLCNATAECDVISLRSTNDQHQWLALIRQKQSTTVYLCQFETVDLKFKQCSTDKLLTITSTHEHIAIAAIDNGNRWIIIDAANDVGASIRVYQLLNSNNAISLIGQQSYESLSSNVSQSIFAKIPYGQTIDTKLNQFHIWFVSRSTREYKVAIFQL